MSNLSHQFDEAIQSYENSQRRRFARKQGVTGFIGNGYWWGDYPYRTGSMIAGGITQTNNDQKTNQNQDFGQHTGETAGDSSGMGEGGTVTGLAGGSPA